MSIAITSGPASHARTAGGFYLLTFITGTFAFLVRGKWSVAAGAAAGLCYVAVTILFYFIFKPVKRSVSLVAAVVSLAGCALGPLEQAHFVPWTINPLAIFGAYCLLIGWLTLRSGFLPPVLGAGMVFAALGWLTFLSPQLAARLAPFNMLPGVLGEGALTIWLLFKGVDEQRWQKAAVDDQQLAID